MRLVSASKGSPPTAPRWSGSAGLTHSPAVEPAEPRVMPPVEPLHPRHYRRSVLATALVAMLTWSVVGLPYSLFSWSLDPVQLGWVLFCYAWEVPVAGALGPVLFPLLWFRDIERRWDRVFATPLRIDAAEAVILERSILDFPIRVAGVMVVTSVVGYGVGALQLRLFAQTPVAEVVKVCSLGIVTGLSGALFVFLYLESLLTPLTERFGLLGGAVQPEGRRVPLHQKVFACALVTTLSALILLGTIFYSRGERVLEEQLGERVLAEANQLAAQVDAMGPRHTIDAKWWGAQQAAMRLGASGRVYLVDRDGTIVAQQGSLHALADEGFRPGVLHTVLAAPDGYEVDRIYHPRVIAFAPLRDRRRRVVAVVERSDFESELGAMLRSGLVVFTASLLLALFQALLFSRRLTRPIEVVTGMAGRIARAPGGPWETVPVRTNDEVGELATAFNQMIARLNEARLGLERRISEATSHIATLYEVARTTTSTLEIKDVLTLVAEKTLATLGLERLVVLWHPSELVDVVDAYAATANRPGEQLEIGQPVDLAELCPGARPTVTPLSALTSSLPDALAERLVAPRVLCLPLVFKSRLLGVILAGLGEDAPAPDLEMAGALATQAGAALANAVLFEAVRQKEVELRKLSQLRAELQEESLRAMSRELHDGFGQMLTVINMDLGLVERNLERGAAAMRTPLRDARDQLTVLLQEVRTMCQVLRPPMLDFGLVPTLHWFVEKYIERTQITVALRTPPEEMRLPAPIELLLYRVAQEALTNVAKHAHAHHIDVELAVRDGHAVLCVADDGVGFEVERFQRKPVLAGVGLLGMRERVAYYRGGLDIRSRPQAGARITVTIPLDAATSDGGAVA